MANHRMLPATPKELLFLAASEGARAVLALLLESGMSPGVRDRYGRTPLMEACQAGRPENMRLLVQRGADANAFDKEKTTVLMHACAGASDGKVVRYLISHGARVNERNAYGCTALMIAAARGNVDVVRVLLRHGADANAVSDNQETPLTFAVVWNRLEVVKALLDGGADVNWSDDQGWTPLKYARHERKPKVAKLLLARGDDRPDCEQMSRRRCRMELLRPAATALIGGIQPHDLPGPPANGPWRTDVFCWPRFARTLAHQMRPIRYAADVSSFPVSDKQWRSAQNSSLCSTGTTRRSRASP